MTSQTVDAGVFLGEILMALDSVAGRKHPSTIQMKQLKSTLPMMPVLQHFITSQVTLVPASKIVQISIRLVQNDLRCTIQVFRARVTNADFVKTMGQLLTHVQAIDSGSTHIQAAAGACQVFEMLYLAVTLRSARSHLRARTELRITVIIIFQGE